MEKLLNLLNEYEPWNMPITKIEWQGIDLVISKRFWFIKWLIDNDKIDRDKVKRESRKFFVGEFRPRTPRYKLLILLSISDTPIVYLISYLK